MLLYPYGVLSVCLVSIFLIVFSVQQIIARTFPRFFHSTGNSLAVEKSALASLRKKTGYSFTNCKKALEMHENDLPRAEEWLKQQALALGWSKATKLGGRQTSQGLVGVAIDNNSGVLIEVNCETDFVARNNEFENMVKEAAEACLNYAKSSPKSGGVVTKIGLDAEQLKDLKASDGKTLADKLALMIGTVGENAILKRAMCLKVNDGAYLSGYAHPSGKVNNKVLLGRLGGLVALKPLNSESQNDSEIGIGLCQHVVGMAPKRIGKIDDEVTKNKEEELSLINQDYLLDESLLVKDVLQQHKVEVVDFKRFECGETLHVVGDQTLDMLETCQ